MGLSLEAAGLSSQFGLSWAPLRSAQESFICISLCSLCQVAPGKAQGTADLGLHLQEGPTTSAPTIVESFKPSQSTIHPPPQVTHSRGRLRGHQSPSEVSAALWGGPCIADPPWWSQLLLTANQLRGNFLIILPTEVPTAIKFQLQQESEQGPLG